MLKYLNATKDSFNPARITSMTGIYLLSKLEYQENQFVERIYAFKYTQKKGEQFQEVLCQCEDGTIYGKNCYYNYYGMAAGFKVYFSKKYRNGYYGEMAYSDKLERYNDNFPTSKVNRTETFDLNDIIKLDPSTKYCAYKENKYIYFIDYIKLYRKYPIAEMCMKLELYRLCTEKALKKLTEDKAFSKWVFKHKEELQDMAFAHTLGAYKKHQEPSDYYNSLQYRIQCGKEIAVEIKDIWKYTTQEKVADYEKENKINASSYNDYLIACKWLQLDFSDTKVLFPHNFKEMHDLYTKQYSDYLAEQRRKKEEENREKYKTIAMEMQETAEKYSFCNYKNDLYTIIVAQTKEELINEGSKLHHCVGRMDYDERQALGLSLICFLRKNEDVEEPFVTIELSLNTFKIKQCYGYKDSVVMGIEDVKKAWLKSIRSKAKRRKIEITGVEWL